MQAMPPSEQVPLRRRTREKPALKELAERGFCSKGDAFRRTEQFLFQTAILSMDEDFDNSLLHKGWSANSFANIHHSALQAVQCVGHSEYTEFNIHGRGREPAAPLPDARSQRVWSEHLRGSHELPRCQGQRCGHDRWPKRRASVPFGVLV